jgi:hypothetical protein
MSSKYTYIKTSVCIFVHFHTAAPISTKSSMVAKNHLGRFQTSQNDGKVTREPYPKYQFPRAGSLWVRRISIFFGILQPAMVYREIQSDSKLLPGFLWPIIFKHKKVKLLTEY